MCAQRAEFVMEKGFIDRIVHRKQMREEVGRLLEYVWRSTRGFARDGETSPHGYRPQLPWDGTIGAGIGTR